MAKVNSENPRFICGLHATLHVISGKWKPLILFFLSKGPTRYGELKRSVRGVSDKMLIQQLKELESDGIVQRTDYGEIPLRVDYSLTPFGASLVRAMEPLCGWGEENEEDIAAAMGRRKASR
ncbi:MULTISPECIES: winged helix-turn-helix transcriptional regulator [Halomonadaceae]|jgi:DNA-binding HxlR family transcriptional regulator|uniref:HTH-type transcriptional regulator YtcD n=1 Tax=Vreelandella titanicae TaxID=664683 RepID=A0AAP9NQC6_9GAMM|nr:MULTISPECIES: helix-turn-helix domain-containing protein [Halomonas]QKS26639.1 putative HTH-type transcriptional regulator YtcD [Halomonas titanicae]CDG52197.1 putative transcriptional regulator [Halomonas sp. A3H3]SDI53595.1 transcriptional regulator, HxlR family [Halomonas titanicae]